MNQYLNLNKTNMKTVYNMKSTRIYLAIFCIFAIICFYYYPWKRGDSTVRSRNRKENINNYMFNELGHIDMVETSPEPFTGEKIVHVDLKGAPPKISFYWKLFPLLASLGATGILIEYEDMFPYTGPLLGNISALNAYSLDDIAVINKIAKINKLKVIPLVPTFGHMEFILKLPDFKEYREVLTYPQVICPSHKNTLNLIMDMLDQVISMHPGIDYIHIGSDEVYYLGVCDKCTNKMFKENLSKSALFLDYVRSIVKIINKKYPKLRVLMWDDEFRSISQKELKDADLNKYIEPVIWKYTKEVYDELGPSLWDVYSEVFPKVWIASAFKGATGSNQFVADVTHYLQNHRGWMSVFSEYKNRIHFQGIIITGWQRYDHFAILCELLPVGIPSLAMSLRLLLGYNDSPLSPPKEVAKILQCEQPYALMGPAFGSPKCSYPGSNILENVLRLQQLKQEYETIVEDSRVKGWMSDYNVAHVFSNPQYVESVTIPLDRVRMELSQVDNDIALAMLDVYDNYTIDEWRETYVRPFEKQVNDLWEAKEMLLAKSSWPRRPFVNENEI